MAGFGHFRVIVGALDERLDCHPIQETQVFDTCSKFTALISLQWQSFMTSRIISCLRGVSGVGSVEGIVCKDVSMMIA